MIYSFNLIIVLELKEKPKKKASHMWGRVMGNLIFKPISLKMQPPIYSAIIDYLIHYR